jgi:hypothetical protein
MQNVTLDELFGSCLKIARSVDPQYVVEEMDQNGKMIPVKSDIRKHRFIGDVILIVAGIMNAVSADGGVEVDLGYDTFTTGNILVFKDKIRNFLTNGHLVDPILRDSTKGAIYPGCELREEYSTIADAIEQRTLIEEVIKTMN